VKRTNRVELSKAQRKAVETVGENLCVSAGAGSGKTRVLVERFLHLVIEHKISPASILAITFTEKAANEMKRRIVERLREEKLEAARREVENASIGTIHSFCARILREHPVEAGVDPYFVILEAAEAELLQERVLDETVERLVSEPDLFRLLQIYGEESVRKGILETYRKSRNSETSFETMLKRRSIPSLRSGEAAEAIPRSKIASPDRPSGTGEPSGHPPLDQPASPPPGAPRNDDTRKALLDSLSEALGELEGVSGVDEVKAGLRKFKSPTELILLKKNLRAAGKQKETIARVKELLEELAAFLYEEKAMPAREVFIRVALEFEKGYEALKREERAIDFDDLQLRAVRLLGSDTKASKAMRKLYQEKFAEILVDEFQDTNRLQDRLLELIRCEANLFVVGDLKQSIYGFRGTEVGIFIEKEKAFSRVPLQENYRARPPLIDFVNRFFETLWKEDSAPFERLIATRIEEGARPRVARLALAQPKDEKLDEVRIREARSLARYIQKLHHEEGIPYRDIACLFEATTSVHFYEQEFRRDDIPYFVVSSRGFYTQPEVRDVVSFLSVLENPKRDVPLAATLRSPLFQISDDTLFWLSRKAKAERKETPFLEGVETFESILEISAEEKEKLRFFKATFERFLEEKEKFRIAELIEAILKATHYDLYVLKSRQGERRFANLRKLVEIAREVEAKETLHLSEFVRLVKGLETRDLRQSQAQVASEEGEVVKLMTIHTAKGLEFPVVILPDLGRKEGSEGTSFLLSEEEGLGIKAWDEEAWDFRETLTFRRIKDRSDRARSEESKRLFYVAMTRAKEKLVLSGPKAIPKPEQSFHEMATWAHWVEKILSEGEWGIETVPEARPEPFPFKKRKALAYRRPIRKRLETLSPIRLRETPAEVDSIFENLTRKEKTYFQRIDLPVSALLLFAKDPEAYFQVYEIGASALSLDRALEVKEEEVPEDEVLTSAEFGTRVHQILEQVFLRRLPATNAESLAERLTQDLSEKEREEIVEMVRRFLQSEQAKEILKSKSLHPELPFVLRLPHGLVHGKIDLVYQNPQGEWVILDYKTSSVDESTFTERGEEYRPQLELYALALRQILGTPPVRAEAKFLRPSLTHRIPFEPGDFEKMLRKFGDLQLEILKFRSGKI